MGIALVTIKTIDMIGHTAPTAFQLERAGSLVGCRIIALLTGSAEQLVGDLFGDPVIDHVHYAADSAASVQQRRWPAQHFNPFDQNRLHAIGMIRA